MQSLQQLWILLSGEAISFPPNQPDHCIDYILSRKQYLFKVRSAIVMDDLWL